MKKARVIHNTKYGVFYVEIMVDGDWILYKRYECAPNTDFVWSNILYTISDLQKCGYNVEVLK